MDEAKITKKLSEEQLRVLRDHGTEVPYSGEHLYRNEDGTYKCAACGTEIFHSNTKFDSHCGWPSFSDVVDNRAVTLKDDSSFGMHRIKVQCANCGGHLGHVFNDAPDQPSGLRYCINSVSLDFTADS